MERKGTVAKGEVSDTMGESTMIGKLTVKVMKALEMQRKGDSGQRGGECHYEGEHDDIRFFRQLHSPFKSSDRRNFQTTNLQNNTLVYLNLQQQHHSPVRSRSPMSRATTRLLTPSTTLCRSSFSWEPVRRGTPSSSTPLKLPQKHSILRVVWVKYGLSFMSPCVYVCFLGMSIVSPFLHALNSKFC